MGTKLDRGHSNLVTEKGLDVESQSLFLTSCPDPGDRTPGTDKSRGRERDHFIIHSFENIRLTLLRICMDLINVYLEITDG